MGGGEGRAQGVAAGAFADEEDQGQGAMATGMRAPTATQDQVSTCFEATSR
ncbi:hypothetical protein [Streptomyces sp. NPDC007905]|uniref:hypothetical protein n=1 Tax=Streptomyces sp. NPDC007905 TaxID=3364788 RepID=UPI0036EB9524